MFPITERAVQKQLHIVCDYLGYEGISTHSFRKWYAIVLVGLAQQADKLEFEGVYRRAGA